MEKSFRKKQKGKFIYLPFSCSSIFHCWWKNECNNLPLMLLYFLSLILQEPINNIFLMLIHCYQRNHLIPNEKKKENILFLLFNFIFWLLKESFNNIIPFSTWYELCTMLFDFCVQTKHFYENWLDFVGIILKVNKFIVEIGQLS